MYIFRATVYISDGANPSDIIRRIVQLECSSVDKFVYLITNDYPYREVNFGPISSRKLG